MRDILLFSVACIVVLIMFILPSLRTSDPVIYKEPRFLTPEESAALHTFSMCRFSSMNCMVENHTGDIDIFCYCLEEDK